MSTEVAAARNNNLVAESDLIAAVQAVRDRIASTKGSSVELQHLLQECEHSLVQNIQRVVQPVTDEAFHMYVYQQKQQEEETKTPDDSIDDDIDPEELVDQEAWKRVQELRSQVREKATSVQVLRDEICNQAVDLAQRQVKLMSTETTSMNEEMMNVSDNAAREKLQEMEHSLKIMQTALQQTQDGLPDKLSSLQDTIAAIEHSLNKGLSQTEQTIVSRSNDDMVDTDMAPEERLASFLRDE